MSEQSLSRFFRVHFPPPAYIALPTAGVDISTSSMKAVHIKEYAHGPEVDIFDEVALPDNVMSKGDITSKQTVADTLKTLVQRHGMKAAHVSLPESKSYLFELKVRGKNKEEWRTEVEQSLDEYVPLPPDTVMFNIMPLKVVAGETLVVGVGYARKIVENFLQVLEESGVEPASFESEMFSTARALLPAHTDETVLIIDIGKTTTKLIIAERQIPRFATTLDVGGDALTHAIQKYFGVSEEEARKIKVEHGIVSSGGKEEYLTAMLLTASAIRDEVTMRLEYWQNRTRTNNLFAPVTRAVLVGGNATVRGLPEYLSSTLRVPVVLGDVFTNFASLDTWLPSVEYAQSFAYTTAIGLALRDYVQ